MFHHLYKAIKMSTLHLADHKISKILSSLAILSGVFYLISCSNTITSVSNLDGSVLSSETSNNNGGNTETEDTQKDSVTDNGTHGVGGGIGLVSGSYQSRSYELYVPQGYSQNVASSIVVAFHGLGDDYLNFFSIVRSVGWQTIANNNNVILMVPDHKNADRRSFLHFNGGTFDRAATIVEINETLEAIYYGVGADYNIDTHKISWIGFSEGASFVSLAASVLSNELKATVSYAGIAGRDQSLIIRKAPVRFIAGTADYSFDQIKSISEEWASSGHVFKSDFVNEGHSFSGLSSLVSANEVWNWLSKDINDQGAPSVVDSFIAR